MILKINRRGSLTDSLLSIFHRLPAHVLKAETTTHYEVEVMDSLFNVTIRPEDLAGGPNCLKDCPLARAAARICKAITVGQFFLSSERISFRLTEEALAIRKAYDDHKPVACGELQITREQVV